MKANFHRNQLHWNKSSPGKWNDPDVLMIGNNLMTLDEEKT